MPVILGAFLTCSLKMSAAATVFLAVSPFLSKRYGAKWIYYAWLMITAGFIIPWRPALPVPVVATAGFDLPQWLTAAPWPVEQSFLPVAELSRHAVITAKQASFTLSGYFTAIWLAGVAWSMSWQIICHRRFANMVNRWGEENANARHILKKQMDEMGISGKVDIINCALVSSPMLTNIPQPVILLPRCVYTEEELTWIIKHELVHYIRKDLWYKYAVLVAKAIHWFNPIIYWVSHIVAVQCEISCDEEVMRHADHEERKRYGRTILATVSYQARMKTELSTCFNGKVRLVMNRLSAVVDVRQKKAGVFALCLALVMTCGAGTALAAGSPVTVPWKKSEVNYLKALGIVYDAKKGGYCYDEKLVGLFIDRCRDGEGIVYYNSVREVNLKVDRDKRGQFTRMIILSDDIEYEIDVYRKELDELFSDFAEWNLPPGNLSDRYPGVPLITPVTQEEIDYYANLGITYDLGKNGYCYEGELVGLFLDRCRDGQGIIFLSGNGEVNIKIDRDRRGNVTRVKVLSGEIDHEIDVYRQELEWSWSWLELLSS